MQMLDTATMTRNEANAGDVLLSLLHPLNLLIYVVTTKHGLIARVPP